MKSSGSFCRKFLHRPNALSDLTSAWLKSRRVSFLTLHAAVTADVALARSLSMGVWLAAWFARAKLDFAWALPAFAGAADDADAVIAREPDPRLTPLLLAVEVTCVRLMSSWSNASSRALFNSDFMFAMPVVLAFSRVWFWTLAPRSR